MTTIRKWVRFLFGFSGTETNGFLILFPLLFIILFSQPIYRSIKTSSAVAISETDKMLLDSIIQAFENDKKETAIPGTTQTKSERLLVVFNPNIASDVTLMEL